MAVEYVKLAKVRPNDLLRADETFPCVTREDRVVQIKKDDKGLYFKCDDARHKPHHLEGAPAGGAVVGLSWRPLQNA